MILGEDHYGSHGEHYFWPKDYSSAKLAQKRIDKLEKAGIRCKLTGYNGGYIRLSATLPKQKRYWRRNDRNTSPPIGNGKPNRQ